MKRRKNWLGSRVYRDNREQVYGVDHTALSDLKYKNVLREHLRETKPEYKLNLRNADEYEYINYFSVLDTALESYIPTAAEGGATPVTEHMNVINRCFQGDTVEDIMESLRNERSPFALRCLESMERNSPLSMKITLRLLRDAINQDYTTVLRREMGVALNKFKDEEFDIGMRERLSIPRGYASNEVDP